jgi:hypothetical protein
MAVALLAMYLLAAGLACTGGTGGTAGPPDTGATRSPDAGTPAAPATPQGIPAVTGWRTDWNKRSIDLRELIPGIGASDPRDVIPPLDDPKFETVDQASEWLAGREPVALLELGGEARAYPLRILTWHEIVNDEVAGEPVAVTFCPLCNSAAGFRRTVGGQVLRFGTSGLLRNSDLVMWDRQTESLWQQITGEAIVGQLTGSRLSFIPVSIVPWEEFRSKFPGGKVLSRDTGFSRAYGTNPYTGYDTSVSPFLFTGEPDSRFPAMERVVALRIGGTSKAYPFSVIAKERAVNDVVGGQAVLVVWGAANTASALDDGNIPQGRAIGAGLAYLRSAGGQTLTFEPAGEEGFRDLETGSLWDLLGYAIDGPLKGQRLTPAIHTNEFWFAWAAFNPDAPVYGLGP